MMNILCSSARELSMDYAQASAGEAVCMGAGAGASSVFFFFFTGSTAAGSAAEAALALGWKPIVVSPLCSRSSWRMR
jgi:hypothetical protein